MNAPKNILIVRTDRIGDVVLSLPIAKIVKIHYPDCKISYLLRDYTKSIAEKHPFIDEVITLQQNNGGFDLGKNVAQLKFKNFDSCIIVYPTFKISLLLFLSGIKTRIGTGYRWYSFLFNKKIYEHRKNAEKHELEYNVNLLKALGITEEISVNNVEFDLPIDKDDLTTVKNKLKNLNIGTEEKIIIIHPGSGGSSIDLPINKMIEITNRISKFNHVKIFITGSKSEIDLCEKLVTSERVFNLAGNLSLGELVALISLCNLFISNSTGPIHIAAALNKFTIGFYPKIKECSQKRWGPYTEKKTIFTPTINCRDCTREQCEKLDCMDSIDIGRVFDETKSILQNL